MADCVTRHVTSRAMDKTVEQQPTARLVAFVEPSLAARIAQLARQNERSISGELRFLLRQAVKGNR